MTFNCPHCGAPGNVFDGVTTYGCMCRTRTFSAPALTADEVRRIVREELKSQKSIFEQVFGS